MLTRIYTWYLHARNVGLAIFTVSMLYGGVGVSKQVSHIGPLEPGLAATTTLHTTHRVTVRVPGEVLGHVDHVVFVRTPLYVFVYRGRRHVIKPRVIRFRFALSAPGVPPVAAVIGEAKAGATVTVPIPVTVTEPGVTTTLPPVTTTVTLPPLVSTVTVPTTITLPLGSEETR